MRSADDDLRPEDNDRSGPSPDGLNSELRSVGGYRLLRRVGEGGMSSVYLSYDVPGRRAVAVKLLADHLASQREFVSRFYREARFSRLLQHPNIVRGFAAGYDPSANKHYLVLEFIDGPSTHTALTQLGRMPVGVAVRIGIDIARALDFLHGRNYVHRDVKPDNILLDPDGGAKLADLGLTKRLNDDMHLTSINQGVGTSYYMPYEQAMNAALVDGRSDIFALGATLYHLLTGQVPYPGSSHEEIIRGKEHNTFIPLRQLNPDVPEELDRILAATLNRDPRERYQDAGAFASALEATGLATRIPAFSSTGQMQQPDPNQRSKVDSPTRADLPGRPGLTTPDKGGMSRPPTLGPPPPETPPGTNLTPYIVTSILLVAGLVTGLARFSGLAPAASQKGPVVHERPIAPQVGLHISDPQ